MQFATLLADIKDPREMYKFLDSFLKKTEFLGLSKRIAIIDLLSKNYSYELIQEIINVSSATVSSTANFGDEKIIAKILDKLAIDAWAQKLAKKIWYNVRR